VGRREGKVPLHVIVGVFDRKDVWRGGTVSYRGLRNVVWGVDCAGRGGEEGGFALGR